MPGAAISIRNLGKRYRIGAQAVAGGSLRESITNGLMRPIRRIRNPGLAITAADFWALRGITLDIHPGEAVGIIGRNGAGKSTLLKILSRITEPTEGEAEICGRVGSLLEVGTGFHQELTGRENIYLNGAILGMTKSEIAAAFDSIVDFSGIEAFVDTPVKRYSSGMYVRLAFAVASHLQPEILIVDEVLAVGDAEFQKKCLGRMGSVAASGRTVLFVSHNMRAVTTLCSRAILLDEGGIVADGSPVEVISSYLGAGGEGSPERVWQDSLRAPGSHGLHLRAVRVLDPSGAVTRDIDVQQAFTIEVEFGVERDGLTAAAKIQLNAEDGSPVFTSINNRDAETHLSKLDAGVYVNRCHIPGDFLNSGQHSVSAILWTWNYTEAGRCDDAVQFVVHDTGGVKGDWMWSMPGAVRPGLDWTTERL